MPTYGEVTASTAPLPPATGRRAKGKSKADGQDLDLEQDSNPTAERALVDPDLNEDDFEEIVDRFESSYNFRFEEP